MQSTDLVELAKTTVSIVQNIDKQLSDSQDELKRSVKRFIENIALQRVLSRISDAQIALSVGHAALIDVICSEHPLATDADLGKIASFFNSTSPSELLSTVASVGLQLSGRLETSDGPIAMWEFFIIHNLSCEYDEKRGGIFVVCV